MISSLFAPSRRRQAALWRAFQRPFQPALAVLANIQLPAADPRTEKNGSVQPSTDSLPPSSTPSDPPSQPLDFSER